MRPVLVPFLLVCALSACTDPAAPTGICLGVQPFAADTTVAGIAYTDDCNAPNGLLGDVYQFTVAAQTNILITMTPSGFSGALGLFVGPYVEGGAPRLVFKEFGGGSIAAKAFLPAGTYFLVAGSDEGKGGTYSLVSAPTTTTPCTGQGTLWYTLRGADISGLITDADCPGATGTVRQDIFAINTDPAEAFTVSLTSNKPGALLWRRDGNAGAPSYDERPVSANTATTAIFSAPERGVFGVHVLSEPAIFGGNATYTLSIR